MTPSFGAGRFAVTPPWPRAASGACAGAAPRIDAQPSGEITEDRVFAHQHAGFRARARRHRPARPALDDNHRDQRAHPVTRAGFRSSGRWLSALPARASENRRRREGRRGVSTSVTTGRREAGPASFHQCEPPCVNLRAGAMPKLWVDAGGWYPSPFTPWPITHHLATLRTGQSRQ